MTSTISIFWHRRDLRIDDNAGLYRALKGNHPVLPLFIFDTDILDNLEDKSDRRFDYIHQSIQAIKAQYQNMGSDILIKIGKPLDIWKELIREYHIADVYTNGDYEPYAIQRDASIGEMLAANKIGFNLFKDQLIFEKSEVVKSDGSPYTVFTPYSNKWKERLKNPFYTKSYPIEKYCKNLAAVAHPMDMPSIEDLGFEKTDLEFTPPIYSAEIIRHYHETRDIPSIDGTSKMSMHLRFGTISIRKFVAEVQTINEKYLNELIWREFYMMILFHFSHIVDKAFKSKYDRIEWRNHEGEFKAWCEGKTGYPIVDAGMRQLNATGWMHNRVRMIVGSFLVKHLLIDWRWGEAYFAAKLNDFEQSSNVGGWQWCAGSGNDAAPYFRIFSPKAQTEKFDPKLVYIRHWIPELDSFDYPAPIVDHAFARDRCLKVFKEALAE